MFTQKEAEEFVHKLLNEVLAKGQDDLLNQFYSPDFCGHFSDESYYLADVVARVIKVKNNLVECSYDIEKVIVLGNFIINTSVLKSADKVTNEIYSAKQVSVWLIRDKKIREAWIMIDNDTDLQAAIIREFSSNSDLPGSFTLAEAREFFANLYKDIFINNRLELLNDYYWPDFIGHCNDEIFDLEDVKQRAFVLFNYADNVRFNTRKIMVSGQLITMSNTISFTLKSNNSIFEVLQYATFLIQDRKIKELWIVHDQEKYGYGYKEFNQHMTWQHGNDLLRPYEVNQKNKLEALDRIKLALRMHDKTVMPPRELECLFYYLNGYSAKETAIEMKLSPRTVESYVLHIKNRFNCKNRLELRGLLFPKTK